MQQNKAKDAEQGEAQRESNGEEISKGQKRGTADREEYTNAKKAKDNENEDEH